MRLRTLVGTGAAFGAVLLAGCSPDGMTSFERNDGLPSVVSTEPVCQTITFGGFAHGDQISSVALSGMTIGFAVNSYVQPNGAANSQNFLRAFNTAVSNNGKNDPWEDIDLIIPQGDPADPTPGGTCADCATRNLGNIMVIEDERGFNFWGDYRWGGEVTLTGFAAGAYIKSFDAVDDDGEEPDIVLSIDGNAVASSSSLGDGTVETVTPATTPAITSNATFTFGTSAADQITGSGGVDNIVVCTPPPPPSNPGTGTIGYWKNHDWPVSSITIGGTTYSEAQAKAIMNTAGGGDKTYNLFAQLVAAKLNVGIGNDNSCIQADIDAADAWLAAHPVGSNVKASSAAWQQISGSFTKLDQYNNGLLCAPHKD